MTLYEYFRSSASYRLRIGLRFKGLQPEVVPVDLVGREQNGAAFRAISRAGRVPVLVGDDGVAMTQSVAILEWLEEVYPTPPMLPAGSAARARVRGVVGLVACDIHPLNNLAVLTYLRETLGQDKAAVDAWYAHWITVGFDALESMIDGPFCVSGEVTMADIALVPQVANARRMSVGLDAYPKIVAVETACLALEAFAASRPDRQG